MRGKKAPKREIEPDYKYNSIMVSKLINHVMQDGKKKVANDIVYTALDQLEKETKTKALEALETAYSNMKPKVEVRSRRVGGSNYQVPVPVRDDRQFALATRWLLDVARKSRNGKPVADALARELIAAFAGEGAVVKKREEVQRMADANKAFAQFA